MRDSPSMGPFGCTRTQRHHGDAFGVQGWGVTGFVATKGSAADISPFTAPPGILAHSLGKGVFGLVGYRMSTDGANSGHPQ